MLNWMYNMIGRPAWLPAVKFDSCNNLLSSVHTNCIVLQSVKFDYENEKNLIYIYNLLLTLSRK